MTTSILTANILTISVSLAFAVLAVVIGAGTLLAVDRWLFPGVDFVEEVKKGNVAAAIVVAAMVLFMAVIFSSALR